LDFNSFLEDEESATTSLVPTPASDGELAGTGGLSKLRHGHRTTGGLSKLRHAAKGRDVASSGMGRGRAGPGLATASLDMVSTGRGLTTASTTRDRARSRNSSVVCNIGSLSAGRGNGATIAGPGVTTPNEATAHVAGVL
jgi:hypothetical protein